MNNASSILDVLIAGGGYVGLCVALSLKTALPAWRVAIIEPKTPEALCQDARSSALTPPVQTMLMQLGVWSDFEKLVQPITQMVVTDSALQDMVRPVFLTFDAPQDPDTPLAYMVENSILIPALYEKARACGVEMMTGAGVEDILSFDPLVDVQLTTRQRLRARLLVAADGVRSRLRALTGIDSVKIAYKQAALVTTLHHEKPHNGRAEEHFLPAGPFASLPLTGNRSSLVWTESRPEAQRLLQLDEALFQLELERRFSPWFGDITAVGPCASYPLSLSLSREFVRPRFALAGDAAHGIHPIAGQGLNLGFWDAAALAEVLVEAARLGEDIGALSVLERYAAWRRFDTVQMALVTDSLNRLFSNDLSPLRALRGFGLRLVDRLPRLKSFFIKRAMGISQHKPRLLTGGQL